MPGTTTALLRDRPTESRSRRAARCRDCGATLDTDRRHRCDPCETVRKQETSAPSLATGPATLRHLRSAGLDPAHGEAVETKRAATQRDHRAADAAWEGRHPAPPDPQRWQRLYPKLAALTLSQLRAATGYSLRHCSHIRSGAVVPHPRTWSALERLARTAPTP